MGKINNKSTLVFISKFIYTIIVAKDATKTIW